MASRNRYIDPINDDALEKNNTDFPSGTGSPYYMKMETFSALIKHIEEKQIQSARFHVLRTLSLYNWNSLGVIKDL